MESNSGSLWTMRPYSVSEPVIFGSVIPVSLCHTCLPYQGTRRVGPLASTSVIKFTGRAGDGALLIAHPGQIRSHQHDCGLARRNLTPADSIAVRQREGILWERYAKQSDQSRSQSAPMSDTAPPPTAAR